MRTPVNPLNPVNPCLNGEGRPKPPYRVFGPARTHHGHTHPPNPVPLVVRLRDLAPHLSHHARARLALDRIVDHVDALDRARDQADAMARLIELRTYGTRVDEYTGTVVVPRDRIFGTPPA